MKGLSDLVWKIRHNKELDFCENLVAGLPLWKIDSILTGRTYRQIIEPFLNLKNNVRNNRTAVKGFDKIQESGHNQG